MAKKKPCEWCGSEQIITVAEGNGNVQASVEVYPDNYFIGVVVIGINDDGEMTGEHCIDIPMNYCPNCGRKLT